MLRNKNASSEKGQIKGRLKYISHIERVLSDLSKKRKLISYKETTNKNSNFLEYRIFFKEKRFFYLQLFLASTFHPVGGVEAGESENWKSRFIFEKNPANILKNRVKDLLETEIEIRLKGLSYEDCFHKDVLTLIGRDREVNSLIAGIRYATDFEDQTKQTDQIFLLKDGREVPLQIKSGFMQQQKHKNRNGTNIPSIKYQSHTNLDILKNKILKICKSYLLGIVEHL